jgi:hypothetical protein
MVVHSYDQYSSDESGNSVDQEPLQVHEPDLWEPMVLALPAALINFLHHEIPHEALMNDGEIAQYN